MLSSKALFFSAKCTGNNLEAGLRPDHAGGAYSAPQIPFHHSLPLPFAVGKPPESTYKRMGGGGRGEFLPRLK